MSWHEAFESELIGVIVQAWPEIEGRVYTSVQTARENLLQALDNELVVVPLAVVQVGRAVREDRFGVHNRAFRVPTTILLLSPIVAASEAMSALDTLQTVIERSSHNSFRAVEGGEWDVQETNAALAALNDAKMNLHAGVLTYQPGLLAGEFQL